MGGIFCLFWILVGVGILIKEANARVYGSGIMSIIGSVLTVIVILLAALTGKITDSGGCIGLMLCGALCLFSLIIYLITDREEDVFRQGIIVCSAYLVPLFTAVCMLELINLPASGRSADFAGFGVLVGIIWGGQGMWVLHRARQERAQLEEKYAQIVAGYEPPENEQELVDAFRAMRSPDDHTPYTYELGVEAWRKRQVQALANLQEAKNIKRRARRTKKARERLMEKLLPKL